MLSPSSNSAAGMVMREAMLLRQFGKAYPVPEARDPALLQGHAEVRTLGAVQPTFNEPVTRNGLDLANLRQGSFFTAGGKARVPGSGDSYGTARELMRYLLRMEQGRLVDEFSSREIKRLIYVTESRIRYASSPALAQAAVYFKSGSLFQCAPEPGFTCKPYAGNVKNYMNSAAIIESPAGERKLHYLSTLVTNILRKNSASEHQALATRIQGVMGEHEAVGPARTRQPPRTLNGRQRTCLARRRVDQCVHARAQSHQPFAAIGVLGDRHHHVAAAAGFDQCAVGVVVAPGARLAEDAHTRHILQRTHELVVDARAWTGCRASVR